MTTYFVTILAAALGAWTELRVALDRADHPVPCRAAPDVWTTEIADPDDITYAEQSCRRCSVLTRCAAYADMAGESGAVWGGRFRPSRPTTEEIEST